MKQDILTIMWKESKGLLRFGSSGWRGLAVLLMPIAMFGVIFPIQFRDEWLTSGWSILVSFLTPLILIATVIAESFAGERERHTLNTLLASRLPDRAILFGKLLTAVVFGWGMTLLLLTVSLVTVNLLIWNGTFQIYQTDILWINIGVSLLVSGMVANLGILISLRSATVQSATQAITFLIFLPFLLLQAAVFLLPTFLPKESIKALLDSLDFSAIMLILMAALFLANIGLFLGALARFERSRLVLA